MYKTETSRNYLIIFFTFFCFWSGAISQLTDVTETERRVCGHKLVDRPLSQSLVPQESHSQAAKKTFSLLKFMCALCGGILLTNELEKRLRAYYYVLLHITVVESRKVSLRLKGKTGWSQIRQTWRKTQMRPRNANSAFLGSRSVSWRTMNI